MFGIIADLLTLLSTTLFPLFAAYKALRNPSPGALAPWLIFYATISVVHLLENTILYPLTYVPFYSWIRLFGHIYLLMPAPQGATQVYNTYIEPLLQQYETDIEEFISNSHERLKSLGLQYFKQAVDWFCVTILGQQPRPAAPAAASSQTYAQQLLSRFYNPTVAGTSSTAPMGGPNFYSSVFSAVQAASAGLAGPKTANRSVDMSASGNLVPPEISSPTERLKYVQQAREGLVALLKAYDKEETNLAEGKTTDGLSKSRSETEFDKIERFEAAPDGSTPPKPRPSAQSSPSSGWMPWNWKGDVKDAAISAAAAAKKDFFDSPGRDIPAQARSSGNDLQNH